jgi:hypothetical protein
MKKTVSLLSVLALLALVAPAFAQDEQPAPAPAADCKALKGKEKRDCMKAEKKAKAEAKKAEKKAKK